MTAVIETPTTTEMANIAVAELHPSKANPREDLGDVGELAASIAGVGLIEPLVVTPASRGDGYTVVAGHRRLAAAIEAGLETAPCIIRRGLDKAAQAELRLVENLHRRDLSPLEVAAIEEDEVDHLDGVAGVAGPHQGPDERATGGDGSRSGLGAGGFFGLLALPLRIRPTLGGVAGRLGGFPVDPLLPAFLQPAVGRHVGGLQLALAARGMAVPVGALERELAVATDADDVTRLLGVGLFVDGDADEPEVELVAAPAEGADLDALPLELGDDFGPLLGVRVVLQLVADPAVDLAAAAAALVEHFGDPIRVVVHAGQRRGLLQGDAAGIERLLRRLRQEQEAEAAGDVRLRPANLPGQRALGHAELDEVGQRPRLLEDPYDSFFVLELLGVEPDTFGRLRPVDQVRAFAAKGSRNRARALAAAAAATIEDDINPAAWQLRSEHFSLSDDWIPVGRAWLAFLVERGYSMSDLDRELIPEPAPPAEPRPDDAAGWYDDPDEGPRWVDESEAGVIGEQDPNRLHVIAPLDEVKSDDPAVDTGGVTITVKKSGKKWKVSCSACGDIGSQTTEAYADQRGRDHVGRDHVALDHAQVGAEVAP